MRQASAEPRVLLSRCPADHRPTAEQVSPSKLHVRFTTLSPLSVYCRVSLAMHMLAICLHGMDATGGVAAEVRVRVKAAVKQE